MAAACIPFSYTGNGTSQTIDLPAGSGTPRLVFIKGDGQLMATWWEGMPGTIEGAGGALDTDGITGVDTDEVSVGNANAVNANAVEYYGFAVCGASDDLKTGVYTGSGVDNRQITVGWTGGTTDLVCVMRPSFDLVFRTSGHASDSSQRLNFSTQSNQIQSFSSTTFTVGSDLNASPVSYYWIAVRGTGELAGLFDAFVYTGNGADNRAVSGLGFRPNAFILVKERDSSDEAIVRPGKVEGDSSAAIGSGSYQANLIESVDADGFTLGSAANVNQSSQAYVGFAFAASSEEIGAAIAVAAAAAAVAIGGTIISAAETAALAEASESAASAALTTSQQFGASAPGSEAALSGGLAGSASLESAAALPVTAVIAGLSFESAVELASAPAESAIAASGGVQTEAAIGSATAEASASAPVMVATAGGAASAAAESAIAASGGVPSEAAFTGVATEASISAPVTVAAPTAVGSPASTASLGASCTTVSEGGCVAPAGTAAAGTAHAQQGAVEATTPAATTASGLQAAAQVGMVTIAAPAESAIAVAIEQDIEATFEAVAGAATSASTAPINASCEGSATSAACTSSLVADSATATTVESTAAAQQASVAAALSAALNGDAQAPPVLGSALYVLSGSVAIPASSPQAAVEMAAEIAMTSAVETASPAHAVAALLRPGVDLSGSFALVVTPTAQGTVRSIVLGNFEAIGYAAEAAAALGYTYETVAVAPPFRTHVVPPLPRHHVVSASSRSFLA